MSVLAIYGASGLGRELLELASIINKRNPKWNRIIFIDDGSVPIVVNGCDVYDYDNALKLFAGELEIIVGIGEPSIRESLYKKIVSDNISISCLIHPEVHIPETTTLGRGVVVQAGCFISCNVSIGDYVFIQPQCNIGHDCELYEGCEIAGLCNLGGNVHIGKWTYLGMGSTVKQLTQIGDYSIVGMGSVVHRDIPDSVIAMGNPARPMANNDARKVFK